MSDTESTEPTTVVSAEVNPKAPDEDSTVEQNPTVDSTDEDQGDDEGDTFPRAYVEELRRESARYRERARNADQYARRLHTELVRATGKLADPTDLPFDESHLGDSDALAAALDELLARKPHLASRKPTGEIGQGASSSASTVDLAALLRQRAR